MYRDNNSIAFEWQYFVRPMGMNLYECGHWNSECLDISSYRRRRHLIYLCSGNCHAWIHMLSHAVRPNRPVHCSIAAWVGGEGGDWVSAFVQNPKLHEMNGKLCCFIRLFRTYHRCHTTGRLKSWQLAQCNHITLFVVHIEYQLFIGIG